MKLFNIFYGPLAPSACDLCVTTTVAPDDHPNPSAEVHGGLGFNLFTVKSIVTQRKRVIQISNAILYPHFYGSNDINKTKCSGRVAPSSDIKAE